MVMDHLARVSLIKKAAFRLGIERAKWLAGVPMRKRVRELRRLSEEEFWAYQKARFIAQYDDMVRHVPHYRDWGKQYSFARDDDRHILDVMANLPVLPKSVVKQQTEDFYRRPALLGTAEHTTGGTTGAPLRVRASLQERGWTNAMLEDWYYGITGKTSPRTLRLSSFLDSRIAPNRVAVRIVGTPVAYVAIYELGEQRADELAEFVDRFRPEVITGYTSAVVEFASTLAKARVPRLEHLRGVITTSETLSEQQRAQIEQALGTKVYDQYGSQERQHLVLECFHQKMHIHPGQGIVEILRMREDKLAAPGELGRVVVTGIANKSMPLVRYDIGDMAISTGYQADCACGSSWPIIGRVEGRMQDLIRTPDGRKIRMPFLSSLNRNGILESQIVQTGYERFVVRIVAPTMGVGTKQELESAVTTEISQRLGYGVHVRFDYPSQIERTTSGKFRSVVVRLDNEE